MDDAWKKEELSFVQNWHSHAIVNIQNPMHKFRGELFILINYQVIIPKVKPYLCCHQSLKRRD
jgi:hypothetical protein